MVQGKVFCCLFTVVILCFYLQTSHILRSALCYNEKKTKFQGHKNFDDKPRFGLKLNSSLPPVECFYINLILHF